MRVSGCNMATPDEQSSHPVSDKLPRTERGRRTMRKLLDAAAKEFGEKGFHQGSISGITRRAGVALGSFYTYFDTKDEIFRALVRDMSGQVAQAARGAITPELTALEVERAALSAFIDFARANTEIYRIIDESEFVDPETFRAHYQGTAQRIRARLQKGIEAGEFRDDLDEAHAWAIMGMNVFLGLRYAIFADDRSSDDVAKVANAMLERGICNPSQGKP